jgi:hypothetical protein
MTLWKRLALMFKNYNERSTSFENEPSRKRKLRWECKSRKIGRESSGTTEGFRKTTMMNMMEKKISEVVTNKARKKRNGRRTMTSKWPKKKRNPKS